MMIVFHHEEYTIGNYGWSALMESYLSRDCVDKFGQGPKSHNYNYLSVAWKKRIMNKETFVYPQYKIAYNANTCMLDV